MVAIDRNVQGIVLIVDEERQLMGTITDGDIRRAVLDGVDLNNQVSTLIERKRGSLYGKPITASVNSTREDQIVLMKQFSIRQLPIVDERNCVVDVVQLDAMPHQDLRSIRGVVMAGGFGTRMRPLTDDMPKPMLPMGDRPLLQRILEQFRTAGIRRVNIMTHYLPEKITEYFGDGTEFGLDLDYVNEDKPLGTAGALGLMDNLTEPLLVINGDILTEVDFREMLKFHEKHHADLTMAVRQYEFRVPYGVIECDGPFVRNLREKPTYHFLVNAGIYLIEPTVHNYIPNNQRFDMTDLIDIVMKNGGSVVSFPVIEYWLDIGQHVDYNQAQEDLKNGRVKP